MLQTMGLSTPVIATIATIIGALAIIMPMLISNQIVSGFAGVMMSVYAFILLDTLDMTALAFSTIAVFAIFPMGIAAWSEEGSTAGIVKLIVTFWVAMAAYFALNVLDAVQSLTNLGYALATP